ncbi:hypothetical protein N9V68_00155 [Octadecabacter sp.]|nr:hypothetical protein [Octadecabacter sp.]
MSTHNRLDTSTVLCDANLLMGDCERTEFGPAADGDKPDQEFDLSGRTDPAQPLRGQLTAPRRA